MRRLDASEFFADANLKSVVADTKGESQADKFSLQINMVLPGEEENNG